MIFTGAWRVLPKTASPDIRSAVRSVLQEPSYRRAAETAGGRLRARNGAIAAVASEQTSDARYTQKPAGSQAAKTELDECESLSFRS
jgi:hypothetical protein